MARAGLVKAESLELNSGPPRDLNWWCSEKTDHLLHPKVCISRKLEAQARAEIQTQVLSLITGVVGFLTARLNVYLLLQEVR